MKVNIVFWIGIVGRLAGIIVAIVFLMSTGGSGAIYFAG